MHGYMFHILPRGFGGRLESRLEGDDALDTGVATLQDDVLGLRLGDEGLAGDEQLLGGARREVDGVDDVLEGELDAADPDTRLD